MRYSSGNVAAWWADRQRADAREWVRVSSEFGEFARIISQRDDIIGVVEPKHAMGHPGVYVETSATVQLDPDICAPGANPADIHMDTEVGRLEHPALAGVGGHEAGHARFSRWSTRFTSDTHALVDTALLLEESRMEKFLLDVSPSERVNLRAAVELIIEPGKKPVSSVRHAMHLGGLTLARVDAGVFTPEEMEPIEDEIVGWTGVGRLMAMKAIWRAAHAIEDHYNREAMIALAQRWINLIPEAEKNESPEMPPMLVCQMSHEKPSDEDGEDGDGGESTTLIAQILSEISEDAEEEAADQVDEARVRDEAAKREADAEEAEEAKKSGMVFIPGGYLKGNGQEGLGRLRQPTVHERAMSNQLAKAIRKAQHRDRSKTVVASAVPPGRLRTSAAVRRSAQRSMGIPVTAEPWRQIVRKQVDEPPIAVGIICDISGSMSAMAEPTASMAWCLAHAIHQNDGDTATAAYGVRVHPVVRPGDRPKNVQTFEACGGWENFSEALRSVDGALNLTKGTGVRMLVVISDGHYRERQRAAGTALMKRMLSHGVRVIWLGTDRTDEPIDLPGVRYVPMVRPTDMGKIVGDAMIASLNAA